jgi:hypothetical protein
MTKDEHLMGYDNNWEEVRRPYPKKPLVLNKGEKRDKKTIKRNKRNVKK